jgi:hypothetical protein
VVKLACGHYYHRECILAAYAALGYMKCPNCRRVYPEVVGAQPPGQLTIWCTRGACAGFERKTQYTWKLRFEFPSGTQSDWGPTPGRPFKGGDFTAFLPVCPEFTPMLAGIVLAFKHRFIFKVSPGPESTILLDTSWIQLKTRMHCQDLRLQDESFPDPYYMYQLRDSLSHYHFLE